MVEMIHKTDLAQLNGLMKGVDCNRDGNLKGTEVKIFKESAAMLGIDDDTVTAYLDGFKSNGHIVQEGADEKETAKLDRENFANGKSADTNKTSRNVKNKTVALQQQCMRDLINVVKDFPAAQKAMILSQMTYMPRPGSDVSEYKQSLENWANTLLVNANINTSQIKLDASIKDGFEEQADMIKEEHEETIKVVKQESESIQKEVKEQGAEIKKEVQEVKKEVINQGKLTRVETKQGIRHIHGHISTATGYLHKHIDAATDELKDELLYAKDELLSEITKKFGNDAVDVHLLNVRSAMDRDNDYFTSNTTQRRFDNWLVLLAEQKKKGDPLYEEKCKQVAAWIDGDFNVTKSNDKEMIEYIKGAEETFSVTTKPTVPEH